MIKLFPLIVMLLTASVFNLQSVSAAEYFWEDIATVGFEELTVGTKPNTWFYKYNTNSRLVVNEGYNSSKSVLISGTSGNWGQNRLMKNDGGVFSSIYDGTLTVGETYRWSCMVKLYDDGTYTLPQEPMAYIAGNSSFSNSNISYPESISKNRIYKDRWTELSFEFVMGQTNSVCCSVLSSETMKILVDDFKISRLTENSADAVLYKFGSGIRQNSFSNGSYVIKADIRKQGFGDMDVLLAGAVYDENKLVRVFSEYETVTDDAAVMTLPANFTESDIHNNFKITVFNAKTITPLCETVCYKYEDTAPMLPELDVTIDNEPDGGEVILSESSIFTLNQAGKFFDYYEETATLNRGLGTVTYMQEEDETLPFSEKVNVNVPQYFNSDGWTKLTINPDDDIAKGDYLLLTFYARVLYSEQDDGTGIIGFKLQNSNAELNYPNSVNQSYTLTPEWHKYYIPFPAKYDHNAGGYALIIRLAGSVQNIEIGGFKLINYKNNVNYSELPITHYTSYEGIEENASWRIDAQKRIEENRKGDIKVKVVDKNGNSVENAYVELLMKKHEFDFGGVVWNSKNTENEAVFDKVTENFNTVVIGNNLKWKHWVRESKRTDALNLLKWAQDNGIKARGHCLVWDSGTHRPDEYKELSPDEAVKALDLHIKDIVSTCNGYVYEWDVLNEPVTNHGLFDSFNKDYTLYKKWFDTAREYAPDAKLYINDASVRGVNTNNYRTLKEILSGMNKAGVDYDAIGIEGHFSAPCGIEAFYNQLNELSAFGKEFKITEFDMKGSEAIKARFAKDMLTIAFSHPDVNGFLMWTWFPTKGENESGSDYQSKVMYDSDMKLTPTGEQLRYLIFDKWWTNENGRTNENGEITKRGFYGDYELAVTVDGVKNSRNIQVLSGSENEFTVMVGE